MRADLVYELLADVSNSAADAALVEALAGAEPEYRRRILEALLARDTVAARLGVVEQYHQLDEDCRKRLNGKVKTFSTVWGTAIRSESRTARANTVAMISDLNDVRSAYVLVAALHVGDSDTRQAAGQALIRFAKSYVELRCAGLQAAAQRPREGAKLLGEAGRQRRHLLGAIADGLQSFTAHKRHELVTAFAILADEFPPQVWSRVDRLGPTFVKPLADTVCGRWDRLAAGLLVAGLRCDSLRNTLLRTWADTADLETFELLMLRFGRVADPAICNVLRGLQTQHFLDQCGESDFIELSAEAQVQALRFIACTGLSDDLKLQVYRIGVARGATAAQLEAVWQLCNARKQDPVRTLAWAAKHSRGPAHAAALGAVKRFAGEVAYA